MKVHTFILMGLLAFSFFFAIPGLSSAESHLLKNRSILLVQNEEKSSPEEETVKGVPKAILEYEREKLAKMKRNIGKRLMFVRTNNPVEFYVTPDDLESRLLMIRDKEVFEIVDVVQNSQETMNFYKVKFEMGQTGYLSADPYTIELKIKEGSLQTAPKKVIAKNKGTGRSRGQSIDAVELVKNHPTLTDPVTGKKRSVEKRMVELRAKTLPNLRWNYEAKRIGKNRYRVTQYSGEKGKYTLIRTWIVDLSINEVTPDNKAAKELYQ
jgi:hypothetical protein